MKILVLAIATLVFSACSTFEKESDNNVTVVPASKLNWEKLNPARGEKSPQAATLWGDRKSNKPTGFLVKFVDGFSSPQHVHNVSYKGVVIDGLVHNDDPKAAKMWMPTGAYWTQPKGEAHITAAKGKNNVAFIEIDQGPYMVIPTTQAFDSGERPLNVDPSNMVWHGQVTHLWGNPSKGNGTLVKIPANTKAFLIGNKGRAKVVVIKGKPSFGKESLEPGSFISSEKFKALNFTTDDKDALLYVRTRGTFEIQQYSLAPPTDDEKKSSGKRCSGWGYMDGCKK